MPTQVASLYAVLSLQDNFSGTLRNAENQARGFGSRLQGLGNDVRNFGAQWTIATAPITAFGVTGVHTAMTFEDALAEISARTGLVGDDLNRIRSLAIQMGADTAFSATDAAQAFLQLLSSGQNAEEAITTLPAVLNGAAAAGEDLGYTADAVTDIMASFGLGVEDAAGIVEVLAQASGSSSATMGDLFQAMANVGGVASQYGLSVGDTAAILALFAENGIKGAEAGTQLRSMLMNMSRDTTATSEAWTTLGVSLFNADGSVRNLNDVFGDLGVAMGGLTEEERIRLSQDMAGSYGILGLTALVTAGGFDAMRGRMDEQASASDIASKRMDTLSGRLESLGGSVETLQITVLQPFIENTLKPLIENMIGVINQVTKWAQENPELANTIVGIGAVAILLGPTLVILGTVISSVGTIVSALTGGVALLGGAFTLLTGPIGIVVSAIAAAIATFKIFQGELTETNRQIRETTSALLGTGTGAASQQIVDRYVLEDQARAKSASGAILSAGPNTGAARGFGFAEGGWTGNGPANEIAGAVHNQEYVVPREGALVSEGGGDTYHINVNVPAEYLTQGQVFGQRLVEELRRRG